MQNLHNEAEIEGYLESVRRSLSKMPATEQEAELTEVRNHLLDLTRAHVELGENAEHAVHAAMSQFGDPKSVGTNLRRAWEQGRNRGLPGSLGSAVAWTMGTALALNLLHFVLQWTLSWVTDGYRALGHSVLYVMYGMFLFGCGESVLTGYITGRKAPRRALAGTLLTSTLITGCSMAYSISHIPSIVLPYYLWSSTVTIGIGFALQCLGVSLGRKRFLRRRRATA